jgi:small subunit ribosomal protein S1
MDDFAKALEQHDYEFKKGQVVRGKVHSYENDGAYIDIGGKSLAFVPSREIALDGSEDLSEALPLQEEMDFLIVREQDAEGQVTLSRRQLEVERIWHELLQLWDEDKSVQVRVTGTNKGGVTVDLRGLRGFIPRSHLSQRENLTTLVGETLTVNFLEADRDRNKLVLSQRQAARAKSFSQLELGQLVEGEVASIKPFGVFVNFDGTTGLLHIKQVSQNFVESLPAVFQVGQPIKAMIVSLDEDRGRISLSTQVLENYPGEMLEKTDEVMASAEARFERARTKVMQP